MYYKPIGNHTWPFQKWRQITSMTSQWRHNTKWRYFHQNCPYNYSFSAWRNIGWYWSMEIRSQLYLRICKWRPTTSMTSMWRHHVKWTPIWALNVAKNAFHKYLLTDYLAPRSLYTGLVLYPISYNISYILYPIYLILRKSSADERRSGLLDAYAYSYCAFRSQ